MRSLSSAEGDILARAIRAHNKVASGSTTITGLSSAKSLGAVTAIPAGVNRAVVDVDLVAGVAVRFWLDGSTPTSTTGHFVAPGDQVALENGNEVVNAKFIESGGSGAVLQVTFFSGGME